MGNLCFGGDDDKPKVQRKDRKRIGSNPASPALNRHRGGRSAPQGIAGASPIASSRAPGGGAGGGAGGSGRGRDPDEDVVAALEARVLGTSVTDQRQAEYDEIRGIIETTQTNFIELGGRPMALDPQDAARRTQVYQELMGRARVGRLPMGLPASALDDVDMGTLVGLMGGEKMELDERDDALQVADDVAAAVHGVRVQSGERLVVQFDEL